MSHERLQLPFTLVPRAAALAAAVILAAACDSAPTPDQLRNMPACPKCTITLTPLPTIGGPAPDDALPGQLRKVNRDARGNFWVSMYGAMPAVYDSMGRILPDIALQGAGPGELSRNAVVVRATGDSIHILDFGNGRMTVFDSDRRQLYDRKLSLPDMSYGLLEIEGGFIGASRGRTAQQEGFPMHLYDTSGVWVRSFGGAAVTASGNGDLAHYTILGASSYAGRFWEADRFAYRITLWSTTGEELLEIIRDVPWFPSGTAMRNPNPDAPPIARLWGLAEFAGYLWAFTNVADERWESAFGAPAIPANLPPGVVATPRPSITDFNKLYDTYIEVFEISTGQLVASQRVDQAIVDVPSGGTVLGVVDDGTVLQPYTIRLVR